MASYDNSRYTYAQVLSGTGYYKQDSNLKYSLGVKTMQTKLNNAGFWCAVHRTENLVQTRMRWYEISKMPTVLLWMEQLDSLLLLSLTQ